ncbi:MAG: metal-dependent hydrolase [Mucilaginibacter sp.]|uniref:metal-dependent hydrolase n=1 Tax=Mucilaginibacter sp. L3T2-6 TaxID=3062491 RepID=UPI0026759DBA|nr:metal-dependent hydrolase [Mucilaginibacter sp. L3T2-6]MDO3643555.1 metal-dependent hydrolase [Mucilaginibacter sp. L3T2-6]MDV6216006.1 metal-dependent hydrolase [Mucilaginibacter sp. L3T2-6]
MKTTYYGQSTFMLEAGGKKLLFDPFITPNPAAGHIDIHSLKPDYILVSHGHGDHVADLLAIQKSSGAKVICIAEIAGWLGKHGVDDAHGMNIGGGFNFDFGRVKMVNAVHSSTMPDGSAGGNPAGFVIWADGKVIYFAGDTALTYDMKLLAGENLDWAYLPIGDNYTMGVDDAIKACGFINCKNVIGMHYDTFPVIKIDKQDAEEKFIKAGINIKLPGLGESIEL